MGEIQLWFDFSCPYAYLASRRAVSLGLPIDWRPMLLGGVFRGIGAGDGPMATLGAAKAAYNLRDMHRWAELFGEPFAMPPAHPMRTVRALRTLLGLDHAHWPAAIAGIYTAYWQRGEDITTDAVIARALAGAGIGEAEIAAALVAADGDRVKNDLRARTDEAIELGIFGAPAFVFPDRTLVWGQDRFAFVTAIATSGWAIDSGAPPPHGPHPFSTDLRAHAGATLDVYFDVSSPFAYLALTQLPRMAEALGVVPRLVPILLGGLFKDIGTANVPLLTFPPPKLRYVGNEMSRWAAWWGEPLAMPAKFPQRTVTAQRLCVIAAGEGAGARVALALARAMWAEDRNLEDPDTLAEIVDACGEPGAAWVARAGDAEIKAALVANTAAAKAAGVFGVPTFVVDGEMLVWGQDRLELVARALHGWKPVHG